MVGIVGLETADNAPSPCLLPNSTAIYLVVLPIRSLTFDATITKFEASATMPESRRVKGELATTAVAPPVHYPSPYARVAVVAWHVVGSMYRQVIYGVNFHWKRHETCTAGQVENAETGRDERRRL